MTTKKAPTPKTTTIKKVTTTPKVVITKQRDFTHKEPIIIPSHLDEIPVISAASYIKDARNRWYIHNRELESTWDVHVDLFNKVKPHVLEAHEDVVKRYQELTNE